MKKTKRAFSLIELSIVLVIVAIVIAGTLSVSTVSINNAKIKTTNDRIAAIYKAIGNFVLVNYRLPCPASLTIARDTNGYGASTGTPGSCTSGGTGIYKSNFQSGVVYGALPCATLNLPPDLCEDGFGNKLAYIVVEDFTAAEYPSAVFNNKFSSRTEDSASLIRIYQVPTTGYLDLNMFAIISHGSNKYGAFNAKSTTQNSVTSSDIFEQQNYISGLNNTTLTANFGNLSSYQQGSRTVFTYTNPSSDIFDDIVFAKTRGQLVMDFNAMFLIPCIGDVTFPTVYYGQITYRSSACSIPSGTKATKRCNAFGTWSEEQWCASF